MKKAGVIISCFNATKQKFEQETLWNGRKTEKWMRKETVLYPSRNTETR